MGNVGQRGSVAAEWAAERRRAGGRESVLSRERLPVPAYTDESLRALVRRAESEAK